MVQRLVLGIAKGLGIGTLLAWALVSGLGVQSLVGGLGYLAAILAGVLIAFVAGKPIWARGAWVEVLLKSIAGAAITAALWFVASRYVPTTVNLAAIGSTRLVTLPWLILPTLSTLLAVFFELDHDSGSDEPGSEARAPVPKQRVATSPEDDVEVDLYAEDQRPVDRREL